MLLLFLFLLLGLLLLLSFLLLLLFLFFVILISGCVKSCEVEEWHPLNNLDHLLVTISIDIENVNIISYPCPSDGRIKWGKLSVADIKAKYSDKLTPVFDRLLASLMDNNDDIAIDNCFDEMTAAMISLSNDLPKTKYRKKPKILLELRLI